MYVDLKVFAIWVVKYGVKWLPLPASSEPYFNNTFINESYVKTCYALIKCFNWREKVFI